MNLIDASGAYRTNDLTGHVYDPALAEKLSDSFGEGENSIIVDLGCGPGWYAPCFKNHRYLGYDGNPHTLKLAGKYKDDKHRFFVADLSKPLSVSTKADMVISLEVGEHIPAEFEDVFFDNIFKFDPKVILLSWAVPGQGGHGHVNCRRNEYIIEKMKNFEYVFLKTATKELREAASLSWFKNTLMMFTKQKV